jgi:uncharacterized Zn finger protein (UPF0148 family)
MLTLVGYQAGSEMSWSPEEHGMSIVCSVVGHNRSSEAVWNRDFHFSTCTRCKADLVEAEDGRWVTSPRGYRIVRKQAEPVPAVSIPESVEPEAPRTIWDEVREPEATSPLQEKRARPDRRAEQNGVLPSSFGGIERRTASDRRKPGSNYQPNRRKGLIAQ